MADHRVRDDRHTGVQAVGEDAVEFFGARGSLFISREEFQLQGEGIAWLAKNGYAAGELKHGPIALVDEHTPIVILAPFDSYFEKSASNMSEVMARGELIHVCVDRQTRETVPVPQWIRDVAVPDGDDVTGSGTP